MYQWTLFNVYAAATVWLQAYFRANTSEIRALKDAMEHHLTSAIQSQLLKA